MHLMDVRAGHPVDEQVAHKARITLRCLARVPEDEVAVQASIPVPARRSVSTCSSAADMRSLHALT